MEGYTQIDHKILEYLCRTKLTQYEFRVTIAIIRKTLGFHKKMAYVSQSQIAELTKIDRRNVNRTERQLKEKGVICREGKKIGLNPELYKKLASVEMTLAVNDDDKSSSSEMHIKDNNIHINISNSRNSDPDNIKRLIEQGKQEYQEDKTRGTFKKLKDDTYRR